MLEQPATQPGNPVVRGVVRVADQIKLPAKEPGVLVQLAVKEGTQVKAGQVIGKIDDSEPQMKKMAACADYKGAYKRWKDDVEIRYAQAQAAVAKTKYEKLLETNKQADQVGPRSRTQRGQARMGPLQAGNRKIHPRQGAGEVRSA